MIDKPLHDDDEVITNRQAIITRVRNYIVQLQYKFNQSIELSVIQLPISTSKTQNLDMNSRYPTEAYETVARLYDHPNTRVQSLRERGPDNATVRGQHAIFAALAIENRLLELLKDGECCVCELQVALTSPQSTVAPHLRTLREAGVVASRKQGKWTYYRITDTAVVELLDLAVAMTEARTSNA